VPAPRRSRVITQIWNDALSPVAQRAPVACGCERAVRCRSTESSRTSRPRSRRGGDGGCVTPRCYGPDASGCTVMLAVFRLGRRHRAETTSSHLDLEGRPDSASSDSTVRPGQESEPRPVDGGGPPRRLHRGTCVDGDGEGEMNAVPPGRLAGDGVVQECSRSVKLHGTRCPVESVTGGEATRAEASPETSEKD